MFVYPAHAANNACHKRRLTTARKNNCAIASQAFACKPTFFLGRTWASKHLEGMYSPLIIPHWPMRFLIKCGIQPASWLGPRNPCAIGRSGRGARLQVENSVSGGVDKTLACRQFCGSLTALFREMRTVLVAGNKGGLPGLVGTSRRLPLRGSGVSPTPYTSTRPQLSIVAMKSRWKLPPTKPAIPEARPTLANTTANQTSHVRRVSAAIPSTASATVIPASAMSNWSS